jgi:hypothetical protein
MLQTMANFSSQVGAALASPRSKRSSVVANRFCEGGRELLDGSSAGDAKDESSDAKHDGVGRDCREQIAGASLEEEPRSSRPRPRPSSVVDSTGATPKAESKSLEQLLARSSTFHISTRHFDDVEATRHCDDVEAGDMHDVLDKTESVRTVVLALEADAAALALLRVLQARWGATKASKMRVVVLTQDVDSAEEFAALGAVAVHEYVASHTQAVLAAVTPFEKDAVLVHGSATQSAWSNAWFALHGGQSAVASTALAAIV